MTRRISSNTTFIYKRVFPVFWFGFLAMFLFTGVFVQTRVDENTGAFLFFPFLIVPLLMAVIGFFVFKYLIFDLADEVIDEGDTLVVTRGRETDRIALKNIINVNHSYMNPERITLQLRTPSIFGDKVTFCPPTRFWPFTMHPVAVDLIRRIDAKRTR
jgi:hypothetical protein